MRIGSDIIDKSNMLNPRVLLDVFAQQYSPAAYDNRLSHTQINLSFPELSDEVI